VALRGCLERVFADPDQIPLFVTDDYVQTTDGTTCDRKEFAISGPWFKASNLRYWTRCSKVIGLPIVIWCTSAAKMVGERLCKYIFSEGPSTEDCAAFTRLLGLSPATRR
jgi:hypothetical protein